MKIKILQLIEGAKAAQGITVIIDVFRAFTTACYLVHNGAKKIIPVANVSLAYQLKKEHTDYILIGERNEIMLEGFDYGNSPANIEHTDFTGKTIIHTTSAGTQGISNAHYAKEILTGSFANAPAVAQYIKQKNPSVVSLVCMGKATLHPIEEDTFCAEYIKSLLEEKEYPLKEKFELLRKGEGSRFFLSSNQLQCPERDFTLCTTIGTFDFVLKAVKEENELFYLKKIKIKHLHNFQ